VLTVTRIQQVIIFTAIPEKLLVKDTYTLAAFSTSGLAVLFESLDPGFATVSGDLLTGVSAGEAQIRAYHAGDQNYDQAETTETVEIYSTHKNILYLFTPNNDGINDKWELPELSSWGKSSVKAYSRWGQLVYSEKDYNNLWDGTSNGSPLPEGAYYFIIDTENAGVVKGTVNLVR
jgi:gliding motility-associated-like protein